MQESGAHVFVDAQAAALTVSVTAFRIMRLMNSGMPVPAAPAIAVAVAVAVIVIVIVLVLVIVMPLAVSAELHVAAAFFGA